MSDTGDSILPPRTSPPDARAVVGVLGATQILAWGSSFYLPAVLAAPIAADTGWPLPLVVGGVSLGLLVSGAISPRIGRLIGTHGGRFVMALASLLFGAGLFALAVAPSLAVFALGWVLIGGGMGAGLYDAAFAVLGSIYGRSARRAIVALTLFGGFASTVCWPLSAFLLASLGWRGACFAYALAHLAIALPLHLMVLPKASGTPQTERAAAPPARAAPLPPAGRTLFLLLAATVTIAGAIGAVIGVHALALLHAHGIDAATAVALGALIGPAQVAGRVGEMLFGGRYHPVFTLVAATLLVALGLWALMPGGSLVALALLLYGAGNGLYSIARGTVPLMLFEEAVYAAVMGRLALPSFLAQAAAPPAAAFLLELAGASSLVLVMAAFATGNLGLALLLLRSRRSGETA